MKRLLLLLPSLFLLFASPIRAIEDPLSVPNNKFGIHIIDENDLPDAANLVNSTGGDWGYVTLVIRTDERKLEQWQETFNKLRKLHLIPIVRIASIAQGPNWQKADNDQIDDWVAFLKALTWVTKNRYVIIGNEPNHGAEWGGHVSPEEYSDYLLEFARELKAANPDFFVLPAGLDASAPNDGEHMEEGQYLERMIKKNPRLFDVIDGWASHSYPNPGFAGSVEDTGKGSIRTFEWELETLQRLGISKRLPVFITETGWTHTEDGNATKPKKRETLSDRYVKAYQTAWNDPRVVAVTPFILNYQSDPFAVFSWKRREGTFYDFYYDIQKLEKVHGEPVRVNAGEIQAALLPEIITIDNKQFGVAYVKNTGQKIWKVGVTETIDVENGKIEIIPTNPLTDIMPNDVGPVLYRTISATKKSAMQNEPEFDTIVAGFLTSYVAN